MMVMKKSILTVKAHADLTHELLEIEKNRPKHVAELTWARDLGDRSENAAYKSARSKLSRVDSRIRFLKKILENSKVVESTQKGLVCIGSVVKIQSGEKVVVYEIVGDHETDPLRGKISYRSPIGSALINKKIGETVVFLTPSGMTKCTVLSIK